ncbi:MAG TPA: DUF2182 domain-containing protein [Frankiaceae bacterium]|nr:DUF2182 domain-containing protein [Frankiaceae bacterium]
MTVLPWRGPVRRLPPLPWVVAAIVVAWVVLAGAYAAGYGGWFGHERAGSVVAWQVMTVAMMGPSCLPVARYVAANTLVPGPAVALFLGGYLAAWTAFLGAFALADLAAHAVAEPGSGGAGAGVALALAAGWQLTPYKRTFLRACRTVDVLPAHGARARRAAGRLGLGQGAACVGSCGALMLAAMATGSVAFMAAFAVLAWLEKAAGRPLPLARPSAAVLVAAALAYVLA